LAVTDLPVLGEPHRHFNVCVGTLGHGVNLIQFEQRLVRHEPLDAVECGIDRTIAGGLHGLMLAFDVERQRCRPWPDHTGDDGERHKFHAVLRVSNALVHECLDIFVVDKFLKVGERLETHEGILELVAGQ
jgi:hypothetical protein